MEHAKHLLENLTSNNSVISMIPDENFIFDKSQCDEYKQLRGFGSYNISNEEKEFPLAFSVLIHEKVEQFERMLKAIYRPQNIYCMHVDLKSAPDVHKAVHSISNCFDNVFIVSKQVHVVYASVQRLIADMNCMRDLVSQNKVDWKYLLNMAGSEWPLRTNYEIVKILTAFNGSNVIEIQKKVNVERTTKIWTFNVDSKYPSNTGRNKSVPPHNFTIMKNSAYNIFHRKFVERALEDRKAIDLLKWGNDTYSPDEWYVNFVKLFYIKFKELLF
jgi:hypothetical protein